MLKQSCAERQAQPVEGGVPWGQSIKHICTKHTVGEGKFLFLSAPGHKETILTKTLPKETLMREIAQFSMCSKPN